MCQSDLLRKSDECIVHITALLLFPYFSRNYNSSMRIIRSRVSLLTSLVMMVVVVSLLLFFLYDTPTLPKDSSPHHGNKRSWGLPSLTAKPTSRATVDPGQSGAVKRRVLLVSLARSGSSLTGDIISHGPNVYYVYEPLHHSEDAMWAHYVRLQRANLTGAIHREVEWRRTALDILRSFLTCRFGDLDPQEFDSVYLRKFPRTRALARCVEEAAAKNSSRWNATCLGKAQPLCADARLTLLKTIRLGLPDLHPLLEEFPGLLIVLLVRDPRASVWSRIQVFQEKQARNRSSFVHKMCNRLDDDVSTLVELRHRYPNRIRLLRYEALAQAPITVSKVLYKFIGLKWNHHVENLVRRQTRPFKVSAGIKAMMENNKTLPYSVWRENSVNASRAWRGSVDWWFVKTAQEKCFGVMRQLGYKLFRLEADLRDNTTSAFDHQQALLADSDVWLQ